MTNFFYICEYLNISPKEFFDIEINQPEILRELIQNLRKLDTEQLESLLTITKGLIYTK